MAKGEEELAVRLGVTGHQERVGIDWDWVRHAIEQEVSRFDQPLIGLTSLAIGADQVFANVILHRGGSLIAVIPRDDYEQYFKGEALERYRNLLALSAAVTLHAEDEQQAFLEAGLYVADNCDCLFAIWDGHGSKGKGGTADVVDHVRSTGTPWIHIDPIGKKVVRHGRIGL